MWASRRNRARRSGSCVKVSGGIFRCDVASQLRVAGTIDFAHPAGPNGRGINAWAEACADGWRHAGSESAGTLIVVGLCGAAKADGDEGELNQRVRRPTGGRDRRPR